MFQKIRIPDPKPIIVRLMLKTMSGCDHQKTVRYQSIDVDLTPFAGTILIGDGETSPEVVGAEFLNDPVIKYMREKREQIQPDGRKEDKPYGTA